MTAERYKGVLREHFIPFYKRIRRRYGPEVVMQEDNALWHNVVYYTCVFGVIKLRFRRLISLISDDVVLVVPQGKKANLTEFS
jgi:hypothetical protein